MNRFDIVQNEQIFQTGKNRSTGGHNKLSKKKVIKYIKKYFSSNTVVGQAKKKWCSTFV